MKPAYVVAIVGAALTAFYTASFALQEWREGRRLAAAAVFFLAAAAVVAPLYLALRNG
ncbi:MAG TPA: hypothetical protein VLK32_00855 [Bacillota bacterium]|nr:hypothetical protein [Bacillota bacterium]